MADKTYSQRYNRVMTSWVEHEYHFQLGTTGTMGIAIVRVNNDDIADRRVQRVKYYKMPILASDKPEPITWNQARQVWATTDTFKWTKRTLVQEVERITQARYRVGTKE